MLQVASVRERLTSRAPPAPFTTASLQQAASSSLGLAPAQTMALAQQLYEGPEDGALPHAAHALVAAEPVVPALVRT